MTSLPKSLDRDKTGDFLHSMAAGDDPLSSMGVCIEECSDITSSKELVTMHNQGLRYRAQRGLSAKLHAKNIQQPVRWSPEVFAQNGCRKQCTAIGHPHMFINKRTMTPVLYMRETAMNDSVYATFEYLQPGQTSVLYPSRKTPSEQFHIDKLSRILKGKTLARLLQQVQACVSQSDIKRLTIVSSRDYQKSQMNLHGEKGKPDISALKREREQNLLLRRRHSTKPVVHVDAAQTMQTRQLERQARRQRRFTLPVLQRVTDITRPIGADEIKFILDSQRLCALLEQSEREHEMPPKTPAVQAETKRFVSRRLAPLVIC